MADQAKGKGIAPKRASNPADSGQSSRPLPPIRTLLEDKEDSEDYSEVIKVLKQHTKSHKRVIASQSSNTKTLLLSLDTLKASIEDSVSAIKNISSTLASLTNSSNATATGKTSYSPRFNPFSGTMDLDSPLRPPRKEPYLGLAVVNIATSNLDLPIDIGSKEGFKDTITSSIVKELSKKAYTIPDDSELSGERNFEHSSLVPIGFSDSDFAGDKATSKSTYGYLYKLAGRPISWKTKRATTIALSTLEAETNGLTEAIREVQWIIGLFSELHRPIDHPITLYRDNQGSITVANDPALHARTKHTLLKFRYVREQVKAKIVTIIYLNTKFFY
ncbi:hypothetical protein P8C59_005388 [Phyllachora maydis]|uniref:Uncharacterized protein n=1 Tax=Phyllachora maydis TaxID=1825666 RepID=A0AAD9I608_9PEZI|nr:hypothetical protein P8C59_005388 [Phyllachora maydis]